MKTALTDQEWEDLCRRCGGCCYEKIEHEDGFIEHTEVPCRFLDTKTNLCRIYEHRFEACSDCLPVTPETVAELKWLPEDCGYVLFMRRLQSQGASLEIIPGRREAEG